MWRILPNNEVTEEETGRSVIAAFPYEAEFIAQYFNEREELIEKIERQRDYTTALEILWDSLTDILESNNNVIHGVQKKRAIGACERAAVYQDRIFRQKGEK